MKGLLTADCRGMSHDTQIGYLLAMVNGAVNHRIPQWAFVEWCTLCLRVHYPAGEWLDSKICGTQLFFLLFVIVSNACHVHL